MKFEELSTFEESQLPEGHPGHYLEALIKRELLPKKDMHDIEHEVMLKLWGFSDLNPNQLVYREDERGVFHDRFWHIALHHLYWKQVGMHDEHVERFERELCSLSEIKIPEIRQVNNLPSY